MILVDHQIQDAVNSGRLGIENFSEECVQPASYDLRVGPLVYSASSAEPDRPLDLSRNGNVFRIPPYGNAVLMTFETLRLPPNITGRFGLKSGFTRKGFFASTGPQVDPGFRGKLFISLLNLTPASHLISYKEQFLSIEFHSLEVAPSKTYDGPYQGKVDIGREILEDLVRLEGLNLTQIQSQFTELSQHIREWSSLAGRFDDFLRGMERQTQAMQQLIVTLAGRREASPEPARDVPLEQAVEEVLRLFRERRQQLYYSDIAETLRLDLATVVQACEELERRGLIEGGPRS